jgi:hypothetical protein
LSQYKQSIAQDSSLDVPFVVTNAPFGNPVGKNAALPAQKGISPRQVGKRRSIAL